MSANFSPTPAELSVVSQIFANADPQKLGVLTGDVAVRVFGGAKLPPTVLGEIWNISDEENKGWLPKKGVAVAVRLIGWAQKGEKITQALLNKAGPLAVIEGINTVPSQGTGNSLSKSPPPSAFPPLTQQDKVKFQNMFLKNAPAAGLLSGDKARDIFVKSKLSNEQLLQIWNLADTQDRGALDSTDFAIGMYFIQGVMTGKISFIPSTLPPGLYQQAGGSTSNGSVRSHMTGNSGAFSPIGSAFPPQHTGKSQMLQPNYTGGAFNAPALPARPVITGQGNTRTSDWDITPPEKASSDRHFQSLDTQNKGYIEGEVAVPFMLKSNLPGEVLAQVWDLADINNDGRLTRDGFAVAMHLIQKKLAGNEIPSTLPPSLVPPSARSAFNAGSPFAPATQTQRSQEPAVDLFSFDDTPPTSATVQPSSFSPPSIQTQYTGPIQVAPASRPIPLAPRTEPDPFSASAFNPTPNRDFLSDDDLHPAASPPLQDQSAEIGNLKNQLQSTNKSLASAQQERAALEQTLSNQAAQLSTIQTQLSSAKAAYETETNLLATLKERRATQVAEIQKTREELIRAESDLSAIRVEKAEIEGAFLRDKEEARDLHKRMVDAGQQAEALKSDVDKLKKEGKQQKGLLAIARKQLTTKENERAKAEKEHEEAVAELTTITTEKEAVETELASVEADIAKIASTTEVKASTTVPSVDSLAFAAAQPLPASIPVSPELSPQSVKSNNPFERLAMTSGNSGPRSPSPFQPLASSILSSPSISASPYNDSTGATTLSAEINQEPSTPMEGLRTTTDDHPTELSYLADVSLSHPAFDSILSPGTANGTEYFVTPPTSAADANSKVIDQFLPLESISPPPISLTKAPQVSGPAVSNSTPDKTETDLNSRLQELEVEESDSDEDSDDDVPLGARVAANGKAPVVLLEKKELEIAPDVSFDDVFGIVDSQEPKFDNTFNRTFDNTFDTANGAPVNVTTPLPEDSSKPAEVKPEVAGVNEFDQAIGKLPASSGPTVAPFSFDAAFDDNFDFSTASKNTDFPQIETQESLKPSTFDDAFGPTQSTTFDGLSQPAASSQPSTGVVNAVPKFETSFDEAFSGFDSTNPAKVEDTDFSSLPPAVTTSSTVYTSPDPVSPKAVAPSHKASEVASPPPRQKSPPPRIVSPKPRLSSSSSKEVNEKPKEPATRHSKLSIRLPFGKKKKHSEPLPTPSSHLTPPIEQPQRIATPASDDDVEPVKQLTAMGFSRSQAVDALEKYGYDVQKALNSLLGQ